MKRILVWGFILITFTSCMAYLETQKTLSEIITEQIILYKQKRAQQGGQNK